MSNQIGEKLSLRPLSRKDLHSSITEPIKSKTIRNKLQHPVNIRVEDEFQNLKNEMNED